VDSTTYPDGSADVTTILKPPAGPEVTITQHFNPPPPEPPGNEDPTKFQATIAYQGVGHNEAAQIYLSLTGDQAGAEKIKGMDGDVSFTLTLNSDQMQALMGQFDAYYEQTGESHTWAGFVGEGNGPLVHPEDVGGSKPYWGAFAFGLTGYASDQVNTILYVAATQGLPQIPTDQVVVVDT